MKRLFSTVLTLSICAAALVAAPLFAQTQNENQPAQTSLPPVTLAVTVADKHVDFVPNLTKNDFTLTNDGKPQAITYFAPAAHLPLTLGLLIQTSAGQRATLETQGKDAKTFLDQILSAPNHRAFVIQFGSEVDLLADVSSDKTKLSNALGQLGTPQVRNTGAAGGSSPQLEGGEHTTLYDAIYLASTELMKKQPVRKALIVLTDGVDRGSKESLFSTIEAAQRANTVVYAIYFQGKEQQGNHGGFPGERHGRIGGGWPGSGYPGTGGGWPGGGGSRPSRPTEGSRIDGAKILEQICRETGGHMYEVNRKHPIEQAFSTIATQLRNQYVLGFTPGKESDGYHKLVLKPNNNDLFIETRDGYYTGD